MIGGVIVYRIKLFMCNNKMLRFFKFKILTIIHKVRHQNGKVKYALTWVEGRIQKVGMSNILKN